MTELKCPFCGQELDAGNYYVHCHNPHCNITVEMEGTEEMWTALIRMRKALDVAVDALDRMAIYDSIYDIIARNAIKEIKALEQITALE